MRIGWKPGSRYPSAMGPKALPWALGPSRARSARRRSTRVFLGPRGEGFPSCPWRVARSPGPLALHAARGPRAPCRTGPGAPCSTGPALALLGQNVVSPPSWRGSGCYSARWGSSASGGGSRACACWDQVQCCALSPDGLPARQSTLDGPMA